MRKFRLKNSCLKEVDYSFVDGLSPYSDEFQSLPQIAKDFFFKNKCDRHSSIFAVQNEYGGDDGYTVHTYVSGFVFVTQFQDNDGKIGAKIVSYGINDMPEEEFYEGVGELMICRGNDDIRNRYSDDCMMGYSFVCVPKDDEDILCKLLPSQKSFKFYNEMIFYYF